ncbi:MAG: helix-turn-helix transcriptional regulator [Verrucomicrobia bacterium]|nr:helix-turn-helix transcriptional regulator [Verrucomicrobiota bacterium]
MARSESNFRRLVRGLPTPRNFYHGASLPWRGLPKEVLLFWRQKPLLLPHLDIHHRFVLILAMEGCGGVIVDKKLYQLGPDKGILIFPFQRHYYTRLTGENILWLFVGFEFEEPNALATLRNRRIQVSGAEWELVAKMTSAFHESLRKNEAAAHSVSLWLSLLLLNLKRFTSRSVRADWSMTRLQQIIQKMTQHVESNWNRPLRLEAIARAVAISKSHLQRICHQALGVSLGQFIRHVRMNRACALLHSSGQNITEIAIACGFSSVFAFSRAFKSETGRSPLKYRQQFRLRSPKKS